MKKILTFTAVLLMTIAKVSVAVEQSLTIPLSYEFESNPALSISDEKSATLTSLAPSYSLFSTHEINPWFINLALRAVRSSDQTISQNRDNPSLGLGWTHHYETGQFVVSGLTSEQSTRSRELTDSSLVSGDNTRKSDSLSVNWLNNLSDRASLNLGGDSTRVKFTGLATTGLVNFRNETASTKINYSLNEKVDTSVSFSSSRYLPESTTINEATTNAFNLGLSWNASKQFILNTSAGLNETVFKNNAQAKKKSWQAMLSMQYNTLRSNSLINLSRSQSPDSTGSINETNRIAAGWTYSLSEKENLIFDLNWWQNLTLNKAKTSQYSVKYTRQISLSWDFSLSAAHRISELQQGNASNTSVMTSVIYKLPEF